MRRTLGDKAGECNEPIIKGRGLVHGAPEDLSSTRAERLGVLAAVTAIQLLQQWGAESGLAQVEVMWLGDLVHRLDNKGAASGTRHRQGRVSRHRDIRGGRAGGAEAEAVDAAAAMMRAPASALEDNGGQAGG